MAVNKAIAKLEMEFRKFDTIFVMIFSDSEGCPFSRATVKMYLSSVSY